MRAVRESAAAYAVLLFLGAFVIAYQLRISLDTVHVERTLDFYVPVLIQQFTNRIDGLGYRLSWEAGKELDPENHSLPLGPRNEVLSVNGRPFRGVSMYLRELWKSEHQPSPISDWHPFVLTIRYSDSIVRQVEVGFPHCTCGVPSILEASSIWVVPPMFCVLLGIATASMRPRAILAWAFLALMLSLSQLQFWSEPYTGFQETSTPMLWATGWFRIFGIGYREFIQHAWPAALVVASAYFYSNERRLYRLAIGISALLLTGAALQAVLEIAWSEDYRAFVSLHRFVQGYGTEFIVISFGAVAILAWLLNPRYGLLVMVVSFLAACGLYWSATPITKGNWYEYSDKSFRFVASIPAFHNTHQLVALLFAAGVLGAALLVFKRRVMALEQVGFLLCAPLAGDVAARLGGYWYPLGPDPLVEFSPWLVLTPAGLGLLCFACSVLRRARVRETLIP